MDRFVLYELEVLAVILIKVFTWPVHWCPKCWLLLIHFKNTTRTSHFLKTLNTPDNRQQTTDSYIYRVTNEEPEKVADVSHVATLNQIKSEVNAKCA